MIDHTTMLSVFIPESLSDAAHKVAEKEGILFQNFVAQALREKIDGGQIDETPIEIAPVKIWRRGDFRFITPTNPLFATVKFDKDEGMYFAKLDSVCLMAWGGSRILLRDFIEDQIAEDWSRYVCEPDENLTPKARELKAKMLAIFHIEG